MVKTLVLVMLLLPCAALAAETTCKKSPALTGQSRMVKGSLGLTPGLGVTLVAEDGTKFIIKAPPDSNADIAAKQVRVDYDAAQVDPNRMKELLEAEDYPVASADPA